MRLFNRKEPIGDRKNKERRRHARIRDSLKVNYRLATDALRVNCRIANISEGGFRFHLYQRLEMGDTLKLEICLKDSAEPLSVIGRVAWIKETPNKEYPFEAGIEFNVFAHSFLNRIKTHIQSITINKIS